MKRYQNIKQEYDGQKQQKIKILP